MLISVVIPVYNEEEGINEFHSKLLLPALKKAVDGSYEILYVNDGSKDKSLSALHSISARDPKVKILNLSRNFGKELAVTAGIARASGDAIIIMDSDGQHPPAIIYKFIKKWQEGSQVVVGVRASNKDEGWVKKWGSKLFYTMFNSLSGTTIVPRSTDYRLIDAVVREEFLRCSERQRITRGIIDWLGFERSYIYFHSPARLAGEASYSTKKLVKLALNSFVSLSLKPLILLSWLGFAVTLISFIAGVAIFVEQVIMNDPLNLAFTGSALLGIFVSFLIGIVLTSEGILAIYLSHIYEQTQARPLYIIDKKQSKNL